MVVFPPSILSQIILTLRISRIAKQIAKECVQREIQPQLAIVDEILHELNKDYDRRRVLKHVRRYYVRNLERWTYEKHKKESRLKYLKVKADVDARAEIEKHFRKKKWNVTVNWRNFDDSNRTESFLDKRSDGVWKP